MSVFPIVTSVTPDSGPTAGGTAVTIAGFNFTGTTSVDFDGFPAASFAVVDDNTITAVTPVFPAAISVSVNVANAAGSSAGGVFPVDSSGNGNNGSYSPTTPGFVTGLVAGGDAINSVGEVTLGEFIIGQGPTTVEWWVKASTSGDHAVLNGQSDDLTQTFIVQAPYKNGSNDGAVLVEVAKSGDFGAIANLAGPNVFPIAGDDGAAHHFVMTYDPSGGNYTIELYQDGSLIFTGTTTLAGGSGVLDQPLNLQIGPGGTAIMDEVAIYQTVLSAGDIAANFAAAAVSYAAYAAQVLSLSPTGFYRFDDNRASGAFTYLGGQGWHVGRIGVG